MRTWKWICLMLAIPVALCAQAPRSGFPWWESPMVNGLNLSTAQRDQIRSLSRQYRVRMFQVREAADKAENDLEVVFNQETVDQRQGDEAIDRLVKAKGEMTKAVSEMAMKRRAVLTTQQWQDLQKRQGAGGQHRRGSKAPQGSGPGSQ
jgi:Spy/CpxP family protein refolding chaperone